MMIKWSDSDSRCFRAWTYWVRVDIGVMFVFLGKVIANVCRRANLTPP